MQRSQNNICSVTSQCRFISAGLFRRMSIHSKTRILSPVGSWRENLERWMPSRLWATLKQLLFAARRGGRRRRALLQAEDDAEANEQADNASDERYDGPPIQPKPDPHPRNEDRPLPGVEKRSVPSNELDEEFEPAQEVLDSSHPVVRMADVFDIGETEDFDAADFLSDNRDADDWVAEEGDTAAMSESLYKKFMRKCANEDSSSSDSSAELVFSPNEFEQCSEDSLTETANTEAAENLHADAARAGNSEATAERFFVSDDDDVITGEAAPATTSVYPAVPEGLHDTADMMPQASGNEMYLEDSPEQLDFDYLDSGAVMSDNTEPSESKHELATASRMERLKPKSANSLTGAPPPKVDGRVEDSVLAPETEVLLVAVHAPERNTFRTYLRRHDIPCRAAISAENAVAVVLGMKPAVVLISGSGMNPEEIITLVDDLNDMVDAPVLTLLTEPQINLLRNDPLSAHVLQYPASLRHIRTELTRILTEEGNAKPRCSLRSALMPE